MAQEHSITGLGDRKENLVKESSARFDLPEEKNPRDGHQGHADGVVQPRPFPQRGQAHGTFDGKHAFGIGPNPRQESSAANGEAPQEGRDGNGQGLTPGQLAHEFAEIQSQQQIPDETAQIIEHPVGVPAGLAPQGILGRIGDAGRAVNHRRRAARPLADQRDQRGEQPDAQIDLQFLLPHFFRPRRQQRHDQVCLMLFWSSLL